MPSKFGRFKSVNAEQNPSAVAHYLRDALRSFNRSAESRRNLPLAHYNDQQNGATRLPPSLAASVSPAIRNRNAGETGSLRTPFHAERLRIEASEFAITHFSARRSESTPTLFRSGIKPCRREKAIAFCTNCRQLDRIEANCRGDDVS